MLEQLSLFSEPRKRTGWRPPNLETLKLPPGPLALDTETTGLDVVTGTHLPVGVSLAAIAKGWYLPWGHTSGAQLLATSVRRFLKDNIAGRELYLANARFDIHALRAWGLDLEALGCRVRDVQFHAALLDEHRRRFSLDLLATEFLGEGKVELPPGKIHELPSEIVGPYAERDAHLTFKLARVFAPRLDAEDLRRVADLEDDLVYAVCEMERNGAPLDMDKLELWRGQVQSRYVQAMFRLSDLAGANINVNSTPQLYKLLCLRGVTHRNPASVTMDDLRAHAADPAIAAAIDARRYSSLLSKYLDKYLAAAGRTGVLRYQLNQLRSDEYGTVTGRFSSSDVNIQQVFTERQQEGVSADFPVRELFVPRAGAWLTADASQIEFRLFGHYADDRHVTAMYRLDPRTDFHQMVADLTGLPREQAKHINFGKLYGMGMEKMKQQIRQRWRGGSAPSDSAIEEMFYQYDKAFPATRRLSRRAAGLAEERGYVRTLLGRRRRYRPGDKFHSAINAVIQGTAADVMKLKLLTLYQERKNLGLTMRFTVHDEVDGDIDPAQIQALQKLLDAPVSGLDLRVPILWDVATGANWKEAK